VPVKPGEATEYMIEIIPTCNYFKQGHRLRVELSSSDLATDLIYTHEALSLPGKRTAHTGKGGSRLLTPFIPR